MIILGIDPGLARMGYGVIEENGGRYRMIQYGILGTPPGESLPIRLRSIFVGVNQLMDTYKPDEVAFEELFFTKNVTNGIAVSEARGAALVAVVTRTEALYEYTPMQIKQAITGYGKADKKQIQEMVRMLLGMEEQPKPDDAADALAVALTHSMSSKLRNLYKIR